MNIIEHNIQRQKSGHEKAIGIDLSYKNVDGVHGKFYVNRMTIK